MSSEERFSICLTSRQGRKVISVPTQASVEELYNLASAEFGSSVSSLKCGFPPKKLDPSSGSNVSSVMQPQERVQVEFGASEVSQGKTGRTNPAVPSEARVSVEADSQIGDRRRSSRAAAKRATAAMPAVIQAQDEATEKQLKSDARKRKPKSNITRSATGNRAGFATSASTKPSRAKRPTAPRFASEAGDGRRLASGDTVKNPSKRKRGARSILGAAHNSASDSSEALLNALNNKGKMGQVLRKGMKNAVQSSYDTSRSFSRLAAIQSKTYVVEQEEDEHTITVTFSGSVDKKQVTERVDSIPRDVLEAVIKGIHASNQEALRPENLSLLSSRVLWSLVRTFPDQSSVPDCFKALLPDLDWSFLRRRAIQLSDKAKENLRQQQVAEAKADGGTDEVGQARAADAIQAVENAMEHLHETERARRSSRMAQAALERMQRTQAVPQEGADEEKEWKLVTPSETDEEELETCIRKSPPTCVDSDAENRIGSLIAALVNKHSIHNWRELANITDVNTIAESLQIEPSQVQRWVDHAQDESVGEIMVEICDSQMPVVEALTNHARTGTPKDLSVWRSIPGSLVEVLNSAPSASHVSVSVETIEIWCHRAYDLMQKMEWLNWYATPVE